MPQTLIANALQSALVNEDKPLAIVLAGHNGSGKSTLWYQHIVNDMQLPLINADRMMLSVLPEADKNHHHQLPVCPLNLTHQIFFFNASTKRTFSAGYEYRRVARLPIR